MTCTCQMKLLKIFLVYLRLNLIALPIQRKQVKSDGRVSRQLHEMSQMTMRNIMAAILQTKGPVVTPKVVRNVWRFLHMMTTPQFEKASKELEALNLGTLVNLRLRSRASFVFIKKSPSEVMPILASNEDLCSLEFYASRYNQSVSKSVPLGVRHELVQQHLILAKQLT